MDFLAITAEVWAFRLRFRGVGIANLMLRVPAHLLYHHHPS